jgi:hypothetical protein
LYVTIKNRQNGSNGHHFKVNWNDIEQTWMENGGRPNYIRVFGSLLSRVIESQKKARNYKSVPYGNQYDGR